MSSFLQELANVNRIAETLLAFSRARVGYLSASFGDSEGTLREKVWHRYSYARKLSHDIKRQALHLGEAKPIEIKISPFKTRTIHQFSLEDQFIIKLLSERCLPQLKKIISPAVYSYLPGKSHVQAVQQVCQFLRAHRDVFLIRTGITQYTDSILTSEEAPLWKILSDFLRPLQPDQAGFSYILNLFKEALRPILREEGQGLYQHCRGISLGTALTPMMANLYLSQVDHNILKTGVGLYVRFGDDIIIGDIDRDKLLQCNRYLNEALGQLHLNRQPEKDQYYWMNRAGRVESRTSPFVGTVAFEYLGLKIMASGTFGLSVVKQRRVLSELFKRTDRLFDQLKGYPLEVKGKKLCEGLSQSFLTSPLKFSYQEMLTQLVTDEIQLKQLDYLIARYIAEKLTERKGNLAFRTIAYRQLRQWGLKSLCYLRHRPYDLVNVYA